MMNHNEIRLAFLNFFREKQHTILPSASMVVKNDSTLMFTNAGMNQFKDIFLGNEEKKYLRVANSQKCLRVSGKHNDLEEVGRDSYHHTMFEMLGNWSFGDYFKKEAIEWSWEFLTKVLNLDADRLYATIFEGDKTDGTTPDEEARKCWSNFLPDNRILYGNKKDNFWEMGDSGPCGPCSEIHIDLRDDENRKKIHGATLINKNDPLVIEIWNLVFIQFNRLVSGELQQLSEKHVDTGMGFERLCMAVQGKKSNYDTDIFQSIIQKIATITNTKYGTAEDVDIALRVVADHLRAVSFAIADGQLPSNNGAGYVIRRILRRAIRYGYTFLKSNEPFIYSLANELVILMGNQFPELKREQILIEKVIHEEESAFLKTLASGIAKFEQYCQKNGNEKTINGDFAFELYDTYGFPIDLTQLLATEKNKTVDMVGFQKGLEEQKERSRRAAMVETDDWVEVLPQPHTTQFVGYDQCVQEAKIIKYRLVKTKDQQYFQIVLDKTPFYAEAGGQVGDVGVLETVNEKIKVINTLKENNLTIHIVQQLPQNLTSKFTAKVDEKARLQTENNHSATHLLHYALREVLGTHVEQKGSWVGPQRLRFDFSHFSKMSNEELQKTEDKVNELIRKNYSLDEKRHVAFDKAKKMGAIALFGEKYGETVRVVRFGNSVELCGGTHTTATGNIGLFKIISESAIATGIRRIEAITGNEAEKWLNNFVSLSETLKKQLNTNNILLAVEKIVDENEKLKKELDTIRQEKIEQLTKLFLEEKKSINHINIIQKIYHTDAEILKQVAYKLRTKMQHTLVVLGCNDEAKIHLIVAISDDLEAKGLSAAKMVKEVSAIIQGGGGGQPALATAGGKNMKGLEEAMNKIVEMIRENA